MRRPLLTSTQTRATAKLLVFGLLLSADPVLLPAQEPPPDDLKIVIIHGDNFTNNIKRRTAREAVVEVRDRDKRRVPGAAVAFLLPQNGAGGTFLDGSKLLNVVTDQNGRAAMTGLQPNSTLGKFQIQVKATSNGRTGSAVLNRRNATAAGLSAVTIAIIIAVAVAAAVLTARALSGGGGKTARISVGVPTIP